MTQQQISTPSILEIEDSKILSSAEYAALGISSGDPWNAVLAALEPRALDPASVVAGMDAALSPNAGNPFVTQTLKNLRLESRGFILIGNIGSNADYEGTTEDVFNTVITALPNGGVIAVLAGTYIFNSTVVLPQNISIVGIHPLSVIIQGAGNFPVFNLAGENSKLEFVTVENLSATSNPVVTLAGIKSKLQCCRIRSYPFIGARLSGAKTCIRNCRFESNGSGIWFQGVYQIVEQCSFSGSQADGVLHFESSMCSALSNFIDATVTGYSYSIASPSYANNKLVANHLGSTSAVAASIDNGTKTVRYANTPDTSHANENNFLIALQQYVGQPQLTSTEMVLTNHVAHDTTTDKDATTILSSLDIFTQRIYEQRSWFLTSNDPTFSSVGEPLSGVFSWDGTTLTWPDFALRSEVPNITWSINAGSSTVAEDEALVCDITWDISSTIAPVIKSLPLILENPSDMNQIVLAFSPASGVLVWTKGYRILTALTSFDADGMPLPMNRYIGIPTDMRNTPVIPPSFAIGDDATEKLGSQSNLLHSLYEKSNLFEYSDESIDTYPKVGDWLALLDNKPETPSHLVQVKGTTYGLFPNFGLYRWYRESGGGDGVWGEIGSNPYGVGPYASMSLIGINGIALLTCTGNIAIWDADLLTWTTETPSTSLTTPFPNTRSGSYEAHGQCDFIFQTPYYSLFTLLDGRSLLYFSAHNALVESQRVFTETARGTCLLGRHEKDTGFNVAREHWIDTVENGALSTLQGLPLSSFSSPAIEIPPHLYSSNIASIKWDTLRHENFSYDPFSNAFLSVVTDDASNFYIIGGGLGGSKLLSHVQIGYNEFQDFTPHGWLTHLSEQEVVVFGSTASTFAFTVIKGKATIDAFGNSPYTWTRSVLGGTNSNKGAIGVIDRYNNQGSGDIHILASDLSRSNRPTWWTFSRLTSTWAPAFPLAVANSFTYDATTDRMAGYGIASTSIQFLTRDASRSNRPTMWSFDGTSYNGFQLTEGSIPGADGNSVTQFYGGIYQNAWEATAWATRETSGNQIKLFLYFHRSNLWQVISFGLGGTYLNSLSLGTPTFTKRTGSLLSTPSLQPFIDEVTTRDLFIWTQSAGLIKASLTGYYVTGISSSTFTQYDKRQPQHLPVFSSNPTTTYSPNLGVSRCDLSIQIGSLAEKTLPTFGAGLTETINGFQWFDVGTKVKQITSTIWVGLNRGGYLWIGNLARFSTQQELTPNPTSVRGDITVTNLGYTDDFDWAFNGSQSQIAIVYRDLANSNRLGFILYDFGSNSVTHERGGASGVVSLGSTPRIAFNQINNTWSIAAQDGAAPINARMMFFRRNVTSSTWFEEQVLASGSGQNPSKPLHLTDGSVLVATSKASFDVVLSRRDHGTGAWATVYTTTGGGFKNPQLIKTLDGLKWWIFGGTDTTARVAWSSDPTSGWSIWSGSISLANLGYSRVSIPTLLALNSSVVVATSATVDGAIPLGQELLIWRFDNSGTAKLIGAFTAKGRLQASQYSGEEEYGITDLSWTIDQKLLYGAYRPTRTSLHWSLRGSLSNWEGAHGDSLLGSGRYITLGSKHFREQWGSALATGDGLNGQDLIIEYPSMSSWNHLPLAIRTSETDYLNIKWPFSTSSGRLFVTGSPSGFTEDTNLPVGTLITSSLRRWPLIMGNTNWGGLSQTGPSVFSQGSMLGFFPPAGTTNVAYFGADVGSENLFKIKALAAITFNGTRIWKASTTRQYVLAGPITYLIDTSLAALGSHLVLEFNTPSSLTLDPTENPLSYWAAIDHSNTAYAIVVGEIREKEVLLSPAMGARKESQNLTFGHLEPIELIQPKTEWQYALPPRLDIIPIYEIETANGNNLAIKEVGSLRGMQACLLSSFKPQMALRRLLPNKGWFLFQTNTPTASSSRINALATLTASVITLDNLNGELA